MAKLMINDYGYNSSWQDHFYFDPWSAGQSAALDPTWLADLQHDITKARSLGMTLSIMETGVGPDAASVAAFTQFMTVVRANADGDGDQARDLLGWRWLVGGVLDDRSSKLHEASE